MSDTWFVIAALSTTALLTGTGMVLTYVYGPGALAITAPLMVSFFLLSVWFVQIWHYAATGKRWPNR